MDEKYRKAMKKFTAYMVGVTVGFILVVLADLFLLHVTQQLFEIYLAFILIMGIINAYKILWLDTHPKPAPGPDMSWYKPSEHK